MAAKKYLSLEEAAAELGLSTKELIGLRERGEIRGFADRGTWKFKGEDVEEFGRRRQADSDPDVPMLSDDGLGEQPTVIRRSALDEEDTPRGASDSDVRLIVDPALTAGKGPMDTDSDVRLLDSGALKRRKGSDSDVKIVGSVADSDSDVRLSDSVLAKGAAKGSDSDVLLVGRGRPARPPEESDSDVKLLSKNRGGQDTEADMGILSLPEHGSVLSDDNDLVLDDEAGMTLKAASGISLDKLIDSGISLETGDSGIALIGGSDSDKLGGSGILLSGDSSKKLGRPQPGPKSSKILGRKAEKPQPKKPLIDDDSSLTLADDSHVSLSADDDMGLVLDEESGIGLASDSGISLERAQDSGISLESSDVNRTQPMLAMDDDLDGTNVEVPMLSDEGSNYELKMPSGDSEDDVADTSVILFDDDEAESSEGATRLGKSFDEEEPESFDMEEAGDDLDVAEDVVGEDDELDEMDVFDAGDDDFDASFDAGESHASFVAPTKTMVEAPPAEWGTGTFVMTAASTLLLAVCGTVMYDLVRSMWSWNEPTVVTRTILDQIRTMF
ncbi:MAG: helix-turn-helix domain-containing protein [Planctomycetaceae bacterium]|nr:helix-turn-helix domain-containing protein [Planctomycetaceae bacterium]